MIALLLALGPLVAQQTEQMRVRASTETQAVAEFEATCVAGLYDADTLNRAAAASTRGYALEDGGARGWRNWVSPYGSIHFAEGAAGVVESAPKCNFVSYTRAPVDRAALDAAMQVMAKRQAARGYREQRGKFGLAWNWIDGANRPVHADIFLDPRTPQQLILMLAPVQGTR